MSHQVRLDDAVYERIKHKKRDDETFSEAIDRLTSEWSLDDFATGDPVVDPETHRALLDRTDGESIQDATAHLERIGIEFGDQE